MPKAVPFHRSVLGRAMLLGVLPAALVVAAVVVLNSVRAWSDLRGELERDLRSATELVVEEVELDLLRGCEGGRERLEKQRRKRRDD
jgi:sensor domain CHASE-containing protein